MSCQNIKSPVSPLLSLVICSLAEICSRRYEGSTGRLPTSAPPQPLRPLSSSYPRAPLGCSLLGSGSPERRWLGPCAPLPGASGRSRVRPALARGSGGSVHALSSPVPRPSFPPTPVLGWLGLRPSAASAHHALGPSLLRIYCSPQCLLLCSSLPPHFSLARLLPSAPPPFGAVPVPTPLPAAAPAAADTDTPRPRVSHLDSCYGSRQRLARPLASPAFGRFSLRPPLPAPAPCACASLSSVPAPGRPLARRSCCGPVRPRCYGSWQRLTRPRPDKKVFPDFYVLGWYSTRSDVQGTDMLIHKAVSFRFFCSSAYSLMNVNKSPVYLLLNPAISLSQKDLPVTIYESELHIIDGSPQLIFVRSHYTIEEYAVPSRCSIVASVLSINILLPYKEFSIIGLLCEVIVLLGRVKLYILQIL